MPLTLSATATRLAGALVAASVAFATVGAGGGVAHADAKPERKAAPATQSATPTAQPETGSDPATATVRVKAQNQVVVAVTFASATATASITVRDPKRDDAQVTWQVAPDAKFSGYYKRLSDLRPGFVVHLAGSRAGTAAPVADHVVAPGRNKKVLVQNVVVTAAGGGTITTRDRSGKSLSWRVSGAKVKGAAKRVADLSVGDVVDVRGEVVEGSRRGVATTVKVNKDVKPAKKRGKK